MISAPSIFGIRNSGDDPVRRSAGLGALNEDAPAQSANTYGVSEKEDRRAVIDYLRDK